MVGDSRDPDGGTPKARAWVQEIGDEVFPDLSWDEIETLRQNIADTLDYEPPGFAEVVAAVEKTSPTLAARLRELTPEQKAAYVQAFLAFITLMLQIYQVVSAATPVQTQQIINITTNNTTTVENTTVINLPPLPPSQPPPAK